MLDTLADWELGYVLAELNSGQYFKHPGQRVPVLTVSATLDPIVTKGGVTITPDMTLDEVTPYTTAVFLLPGADTWHESKHAAAIDKVKELLDCGANVAAICGATSALANAQIFDKRPHTSNSLDYLHLTAPNYSADTFYVDQPAVADDNLITASSPGGLLFARRVLARLNVFSEDTLDAWYNYYHTGDPQYFGALMQTLPKQETPG